MGFQYLESDSLESILIGREAKWGIKQQPVVDISLSRGANIRFGFSQVIKNEQAVGFKGSIDLL